MEVLRSLLVGVLAVSVCAAQSVNISGRVTDTGGTPLPGAVVKLVNAGLTATTGADGNFTLTSTGVHGQNNQWLAHRLSAGIFNGALCVNLQEESDVEMTTFTLQGKAIATLRRTLGAGTNSLALPRMGAGVYLYKVKLGGSEFMIKSPFVDGISHGTATSVQGSSSKALTKRAKSVAGLKDPAASCGESFIPMDKDIRIRSLTSKQASGNALAVGFNDAVLITKDGFLKYLMRVTNADTNGIEIQLPVGTGLMLFGLQRQIVMKDIPAGTFTMGSDSSVDYGAQPPHQVTLSAFAMQEAEVTQEQYLAVTGTNPSNFNAGTDASLRPVETVDWFDAAKYCNALSLFSGLIAVYDTSAWTADFSKTGYRLPTEAQWEYACRAGSITEYWWGPDTNGIGACTWSNYNSGGTTQPVATKLANAYGLYDMTGNVWEWCNDWFGAYTTGAATDPTGASNGTYRVLRGGSCYYFSDDFRSAFRYYGNPDYRYYGFGFRVALPR
jgi:formylglycine-generating enzyme